MSVRDASVSSTKSGVRENTNAGTRAGGLLHPFSQLWQRHEVDNPFGRNFGLYRSRQTQLDEFQLLGMMGIGA